MQGDHGCDRERGGRKKNSLDTGRSRGGIPGAAVVGAIALCLGLAVAMTTPVWAQNLLPNGEFDTDVLPWFTTGQAALGWTAIDHSGCSTTISGAAEATNGSTGAGQTRGFAACVTGIVGGATYSFGADLRFPPAQATTGNAELLVVWFASADCSGVSGDTTAGDLTVASTSAGNWVPVRNLAAVAPGSSQSASFVVRLAKNEAAGSLGLDFDGAYFVAAPGFLFSDGFGRQSACHWSAVLP